jgi:hypothetical protein
MVGYECTDYARLLDCLIVKIKTKQISSKKQKQKQKQKQNKITNKQTKKEKKKI